MDSSCNMDTLDDSSSHLPELSFDDLLDPSPVKRNVVKHHSMSDDEDPLDFDTEPRTTHKKDDSLNTPGPKRPQHGAHGRSTAIGNNSISSKPTPMRANPMKPASSMSSIAGKTSVPNAPTSQAPILLNTRNVLPKMATQIANSSIKITPKTGNASVASGGGGAVASSNSVSLAGKTAVRTSTGQLIYIQNTSSNTASTSAIKTAGGATISLKSQTTGQTTAAGSAGSGKKVIHVMRTADGSFVPIKTTSSTASASKNTTVTLSPSAALAGKKLVTSTAGQVLIKASVASSNSINTSVKTMAKPITTTTTLSADTATGTKPKSIVVQSTNGKQILVSNPNLVKLSPKTQNVSVTSASSSSNSSGASTSGQGQLHAIQFPGKSGVQYVRVLPSTKAGAKTITVGAANSSSAACTTTSTVTKAVTSTSGLASSQTSTVNAPVKILNNLPQKFTVLQKGTGTKVVVTQKKEAHHSADYSPLASRVQKTIVTVPTIRSLNDDKSKFQQQQSLIKPQQNAGNTLVGPQQSLIRKHKISEINTEIKRITATTEAEESGQPEIKKSATSNRVVVISSGNGTKVLNNSIQQPGRVTTVATSGAISVQGTKLRPGETNTSGCNKHLYTILKPTGGQQQQQQNSAKLYSVLKTNNLPDNSRTAAAAATTATTTTHTNTSLQSRQQQQQQKPLINKQSLLQQQQKILQLRQVQKSKLLSQSSSHSSATFIPLKIKEEPLESSTNSVGYAKLTSSFTAPAPPAPVAASAAAASSLHDLMMGTAPLPEDPNKLDLVGGVRRKHCNCSKSQCLKLYCDCFANGEFCQDCTCKDCFNNLENEDERQKAIKSCLERNPSAFKPKITSSSDLGDMRLHNKGCNCKRSGCLKNYCECYEAKIPCSSNCKCVGCRNIEDRADLDLDPIDPKIIASLVNATNPGGQKRTYDKSRDSYGTNVAIKSEKYTKEGIKTEPGTAANNATTTATTPPLDKQQCNFITQEVVDATIQCMITQADECEKSGLPAYQTEKMVMEELGRCLVEIIDFSIRNTDTSYSQD